MPTNTTKPRKKVTRSGRMGGISLTVSQAKSVQAALLKKGKSFKFLDTKLANA